MFKPVKFMMTLSAAAMILVAGTVAIAADVELKGIKCVMSGKDAAADITADYKDAKIYFCCSGCAGGFARSSEKYAVKANQQLVATKQFVQTACPFSGRELNPDLFVTVAGTKVGFCCDGCKSKVDSAKDDAAKLELVFADKAFAKGFKKAEKESNR